MLAIASRYKNALGALDYIIADDPRYMYATGYSYWRPTEIPENDWNDIARVSVLNDAILGYMKASVDRDSNTITSLRIINYNLDRPSVVFARDVKRFIDYLFLQQKFRKIRFMCYEKNPAHIMYVRFIQRYGGRHIGMSVSDDKLSDGEFHSTMLYEIMREEYRG